MNTTPLHAQAVARAARALARAEARVDALQAEADAHDARVHAETAPDPERCSECARQAEGFASLELRAAEAFRLWRAALNG